MIRVFRYLIGRCLTAVESIERGVAQQQVSFLKENHLVDKSQNILFNIPQGGIRKEQEMFSLFKRIPSMSTADLQKEGAKEWTVLDVRTPAEYRNGHIAYAKNVPLNMVAGFTQKGDKKLAVICQSGMRSKQAAKILSKKGFDVVNVRGGMNQWRGTTKGGK